MIRLRDISKTFIVDEEDIRFFEALKSINITLTKNEFVVILGKSGSGKSTLLNIIAGIDSFDNGTYYYFENRVNKFEETHFDYFRSKKLGMVFQNYYLIDHLTTLENVMIAQRFGNQNKISVFQAKQSLKEVGLSGFESKYPYQLSSGERQRVAIARSIVNQPNMIIADEPTGNLDSTTSKEILDLFKKLSKERLVVMVTHDEDAAVIYADRVIQIDDGRVILDYKVTDSSNILQDEEVIFKKRSNPIASIKYGLSQLYIYKLKLFVTILLLSLSLSFLAGTIFYQKGYQTTVNQMIEQLNGIQSTLIETNSTALLGKDYDEMSNTIQDLLGEQVVVKPYHNLNLLITRFNSTNIQSRIILEQIFPYVNNKPIEEFQIYEDGVVPNNSGEILLSAEDAFKLVRVETIDDAWKLLKNAEIEVPFETYQQYNYQTFVTELNKPSSNCATYNWDQENSPTNFEAYGVGTFSAYQLLLENIYGIPGLLYQGNEYFVCDETFMRTNSTPISMSQLRSTQIKETTTLKIVGIIENRYQRFSYINPTTLNQMVDRNHSVSKDFVQIYYPENTQLIQNGLSYQRIHYASDQLEIMVNNKMNSAQTTIITILFVLFGLTISIGFSNQVNMQAIKERKSISIIRSVGASKKDIRTIYLTQGLTIGLIVSVMVHIVSVSILIIGNIWIKNVTNNSLNNLFTQDTVQLFKYDYIAVITLSLIGIAISIVVYYLVYRSYAKEKIIQLIRNK